ncbi:hypothetical protein NSMM_820013 [Nitrosomonas mobilis]|uniref:Uncharacterized protein n=1 Tax=Nitrosomonas mobilis TaxID=51642 RepID=A0A1G5SIG3_9PROT|nr:hypothetical protein NSMM_820013 [Nitrosomonas mobilis]
MVLLLLDAHFIGDIFGAINFSCKPYRSVTLNLIFHKSTELNRTLTGFNFDIRAFQDNI